jgi:hypothetical protein
MEIKTVKTIHAKNKVTLIFLIKHVYKNDLLLTDFLQIWLEKYLTTETFFEHASRLLGVIVTNNAKFCQEANIRLAGPDLTSPLYHSILLNSTFNCITLNPKKACYDYVVSGGPLQYPFGGYTS